MCRLYALRATHPTHAACELLDAQNSLIRQSERDSRGLANPDGWGMARILDGEGQCFRQVKPASASETYRNEALALNGTILMAHVRHATVGTPCTENTHPFRHGNAFLIHNGHIPAFDEVRPKLLATLSDTRRSAIQGTTDSEHVLALLLELCDLHPDAPVDEITEMAILRIRAWCNESAELALNLIWSDGHVLAGSRYNRTLWHTERTAPYLCPICGKPHADVSAIGSAPYRATVLASERITDENWHAVPNGSIFTVDAAGALSHRPITE